MTAGFNSATRSLSALAHALGVLLLAELGKGFELLETDHDPHNTSAGKQQKFAYFRLSFNGGTC